MKTHGNVFQTKSGYPVELKEYKSHECYAYSLLACYRVGLAQYGPTSIDNNHRSLLGLVSPRLIRRKGSLSTRGTSLKIYCHS